MRMCVKNSGSPRWSENAAHNEYGLLREETTQNRSSTVKEKFDKEWIRTHRIPCVRAGDRTVDNPSSAQRERARLALSRKGPDVPRVGVSLHDACLVKRGVIGPHGPCSSHPHIETVARHVRICTAQELAAQTVARRLRLDPGPTPPGAQPSVPGMSSGDTGAGGAANGRSPTGDPGPARR